MISTIFCLFLTSISTTVETTSILLDPTPCPMGWESAGDSCIQLMFRPTKSEDASQDCSKFGAELVNVVKNQQEDRSLLEDLSEILNTAISSGISEITWLVGGIDSIKNDPQLSFDLWKTTKFEDDGKVLAVQQRKTNKNFKIVTVSDSTAYPFICALLPLKKRALLYEQALLPRGAPKIVEQPGISYHYSNRPDGYFVTLPCKAVGNPPPIIKWFKSGIEEVNAEKSNTSFIISGGSLLIPVKTSFHEVASYHCTATNNLGTVRSASTIIRPAFIDAFRSSRLDVYPLNLRGGGARIECQAPQHYPKSYSYAWMFGGSTDRFVSQSERIFISMDGTLYLSFVQKEDANSYACSLALSSTQSGHYGPFFRLVLPRTTQVTEFPPKIDEYQPQIFPEQPMKGQTVYIECFAYGFPSPTYKWSRVDGQKLPLQHQILNFGRVLKIENVRLEDAVRYKCTAKNSLGVTNAEVQLVIQTPPIIIKSLVDQIAALNSTIILDCVISDINNLHTTIEWFRNGIPLVPLLMAHEDRNRFKIHGQSVSISKTTATDSGVYQCIASNDVGSSSSAARLTIKDIIPRFHGNVFPKRLYVIEGSNMALPCLYQASPKGTSKWMFPSGDVIKDSGRIRQREEPNGIVQLEIDPVKKFDEGEYVCMVSNGVGEARGVVYVVVIARPSMTIHPSTVDQDDQNIRITCEAELFCDLPSDCPEPLFDWQFNDRPIRSLSNGRSLRVQAIESESRYRRQPSVIQTSQIQISTNFSQNNVGRFACNSIYGGGTTELEPKILSTAPTRPQILNVGVTQAKLSWSQQPQKKRNYSRSIKLEGYQIEYRTAGNRHWRNFDYGVFKTEDMIIGSYIVKNLEPNQKYQFRVRARSADGMLSAASPSSEWIETPKSPPISVVSDLRYKILDEHHLIVEWDPIETIHQSGSNLRYNVSWSESPDDSFTNYEVVTRPNLVISLTNKSNDDKNCYTIALAVRPVNDVGSGMVSTDTVVHVSREGPKRNAVRLVSESINSTHMNISWTWEELEDCENAIGAQITCTEMYNSIVDALLAENVSVELAQINQSFPAHYTSWVVHDLRPMTDYKCTVRAFDQYGRSGRESMTVLGKTLEPAPQKAPVIQRIKMQDDYNGFATFIDWSAIPLKIYKEQDNRTKEKLKDRGYKIFIYISETAEKPIVLTLLESELQNPSKPSARIDGLKLMYYYTIKIAGFNEGGIGPLSEPTSIRLGMSEDLSSSKTIFNLKGHIVLSTTFYVLLLLLLRHCRI